MIFIKSLILGSALLVLTCVSINAQVKVRSLGSRIETYPYGGISISTPSTAIDFPSNRTISRSGDDFRGDRKNHRPRNNTRRSFSRKNESQRRESKVTCSQNGRQSVRIRGSNQRVEQCIYSDCQ
jgi:hypothetical protein